MSTQRFLGSAETLGEREVGVICATDQLARDGHVLEPAGIDLSNFRSNPIVLWSHQPELPIGACTAVAIQNGSLAARIQFAPEGASSTADEICALVKGGIVKAVSIGFDITEAAPLDPARGSRGGLHITASELLEISFVAVGSDTGAGVVARSFASRPGAAAMLRGLPANSRPAIDRVLGSVTAARRVPQIELNPQQMAALARSHTQVSWASGEARRVEERQRSSLEERRADLLRLSKGTSH